MASGITYAGKAIENINVANQTSYLKSLISGGGGNATWAVSQLNVLNKAADAYNSFLGKASSKPSAVAETGAAAVREATTQANDLNDGVIQVETSGYDPQEYTAASSGGSSISGSSIFGYVVVGLVMVVVLDRLMK